MPKGLYRERTPPPHQAVAESPGLWQRVELRLPAGEEAGLWPGLQARMAATRPLPQLRPDLVLKALPAEEGPGVLLGDPAGGRYFRLGEREAFLLPLLDGRHEVGDLTQACSARFGPISPQAVERFLQELSMAGLLDEKAGLWQRLRGLQRSGPLILWTLRGAGERLAALHRPLRFLFSPGGAVLALLFLAGAAALLGVRWDVLRADWALLTAAWWRIPLLLLTMYIAAGPLVLTHELAHALACIQAGGQVTRFGLMVRHLLPAAFADVSDVWMFPRRARVGVFLAGPAATAFWAGGAAALWLAAPPGSWPHLLGAGLLLLALYSTLAGLVPVAGYDGSEILAEWLGRPGLHRQALGYVGERLRRRPPALPAPTRRIYLAYAAAALLYNAAMLVLVAALFLGALFR